ncbi:hypothetical protein ACP70R_019965 [Stipagrostis hirtigluma subsp. patula]
MGPPQRKQERPPGSACVWVVAALLLLAVLAGGGCLVLYLALPPANAPQWLAAAGLGLLALPWTFWIITCAYRCCCSANAAMEGVGSNTVERQPSRPAAAVAPMPMPSSKCLKSPGSGGTKHADGSAGSGSPTTSTATRRVRFGEAIVLGEDPPAAADKDDGSSVQSHESEAPLTQSMQSS